MKSVHVFSILFVCSVIFLSGLVYAQCQPNCSLASRNDVPARYEVHKVIVVRDTELKEQFGVWEITDTFTKKQYLISRYPITKKSK